MYLVDESEIKDDASLNFFSSKNKFIKSFWTSIKKILNVNERMDFMIEYISKNLFDIEDKIKGGNKKDNSSK